MNLRDRIYLKVRQLIYSHGISLGIPFGVICFLTKMCNAVFSPVDFFHRYFLAKKITRNSKWRNFIPQDEGYATFASGELSFLAPLERVARKIYETKVKEVIERQTAAHYSDLIGPQDFKEYPELLEAATNPEVMAIVSDYFGSVPRLQGIHLWLSTPSMFDDETLLINKKIYKRSDASDVHLDKPEEGLVYLFIMVSDVSEENGPFVFVPKKTSDKIRGKISYEKNLLADLPPVSMNEEIQYFKKDAITLTGKTGDGIFVDVSQCLHRPDICMKGERALMVVRYRPSRPQFHCARSYTRDDYDPDNLIQNLVL